MPGSFELNCADYRINAASIGHGRGGAVFGCTVSPVDDELLAVLRQVARSRGMLRLNFSQRPLLLEHIEVSRIEPQAVRIVGRVVDVD